MQQTGKWETDIHASTLEGDVFHTTRHYLVRTTWTTNRPWHHAFSFIIFSIKGDKRTVFDMDNSIGESLNRRIDELLTRDPLSRSDIYDLHNHAVVLLNG